MGRQLSLDPTADEQIYFIASSEEFANDAEKMRKGNKAAGQRLRVKLNKIRRLAKELKKQSIIIRDRNGKC